MEQNNYNEETKDQETNENVSKHEADNTLDKESQIDSQNDASKDVDDADNDTENSNEENNENTVDELSIIKKQLDESEERYKRLLAEFDNFRKRTEKEKLMMTDFGATLILTQVLTIVDNLERAVNNIPDDLKDNAFVDGIKKIYEQLMKTLEDLKVTPIKAKGEKFDANLHNAVMMDEESDCEEGTITEELQKGFMYKDQVLRHSMVKVKK